MPTCKKCNAEIVWITMKSGKSMPCDAKKQTFIILDAVENKGVTMQGYVPHWATCPEPPALLPCLCRRQSRRLRTRKNRYN